MRFPLSACYLVSEGRARPAVLIDGPTRGLGLPATGCQRRLPSQMNSIRNVSLYKNQQVFVCHAGLISMKNRFLNM